jgi:sec-independent protein translocase protein TatC
MELTTNKKKLPPVKKADEKEMSFLDHLEELRWHILRSVMYIGIVAVVTFIAKDFVFNKIIFGPLSKDFLTYRILCGISDYTCFYPPEIDLITRVLGEQFLTHIKVSAWLGLVVSFPLVFWEIWKFVAPGLYPKEKNVSRGIVLICSLLFMSGVLFGFFVMAPFAIKFLAEYSVGDFAVTAPTLSSFVGYMTMFTVPTGIVFELPVVVYFLARAGLIGPVVMRKYRKHAVIVILLLAAVITPPDVVTQFLIGLPIFMLYEISIRIAARAEKKYQKEIS